MPSPGPHDIDVDTDAGWLERAIPRQLLMSGDDAALVEALIAFCHTNLAHGQPDRFGLDEVRSAFHSNPALTLQLVRLFRARFDPAQQDRAGWARKLDAAGRAVRECSAGPRQLHELREDVFTCALALIRNTLETNFFVTDRRALAFRLAPAYLSELGADFTADLPRAEPVRVTFFHAEFGFGYHIGFSDLARGGRRTVIARTRDDLAAGATTLFRECFVLAYTRHLRSRGHEGGSSLVLLMDASALEPGRDAVPLRLHAVERHVTDALLDVFVSQDGVARPPRLVDHDPEDELIELWPEENMPDDTSEVIARVGAPRFDGLGRTPPPRRPPERRGAATSAPSRPLH